FGVAVVNPSGLADVDLNAAILLLAFAEIGPLLVGIDYPIYELSGVLRQSFVVRREYAGCHDTGEAHKAIAAARLNRLFDQLGAVFDVLGVVRIDPLRARRDRQ